MKKTMDLYTDYLLSSFSRTTATGLSELLDGAISHDEVSRLLSQNEYGSKTLWLKSKSLVRQHETEDACLIFDDTIIPKPYSRESPLNCWHWDHSAGANVKGINLLTAFYHSQRSPKEEPLRIPVSFQLVIKPIWYSEIKTKKTKRKSKVTKNEMLRNMVTQCISNNLSFRYVLADSWFASSENMRFIHRKGKFFIFDMKSNRNAALTSEDRNLGHWTRIDELDIQGNAPVQVWLKDLEIPVLLVKQVFKNENGKMGVRFLVSNQMDLTDDDFTTIYKKRWSVEEYHKSLKQNASAAKSPARTILTQSNHIFMAMLAYIKMEKLKLDKKLNHFAIKSKIYLAALKAAFKELALFKSSCVT